MMRFNEEKRLGVSVECSILGIGFILLACYLYDCL